MRAMTRSIPALALAAALVVVITAPAAAQEADTPPKQKWSFAGPFGKYDQAQLQRGFKIYREVCSTCHSLNYVAFRNLADPGGPGFTPAQAEAVAAEYQVTDGPNDQGEMFQRPGRSADYFPSPFKNEQEARARYNAVPPDMSVLAKARSYRRGFPNFLWDVVTQYQEHGVDYIAALLQGYEDAPAGTTVPSGTYYNKYFPGHNLAMPPPLTDGRVEYTDGTPATLPQYARDVAAFLMWAAEPHLEARKRIGMQVFVFLIVLAGLLYFTKKKVWHQVELEPGELQPRAPSEYPRA
jgi:ubiquinol-cytochrome c reductase cytochrome b/c1 subunit